MKIDKPIKPLPVNPAGEGTAHGTSRGKSAPPSAARQSGDTSVSLGATAAQLQSMESSMAQAPAVNAAKVAEIKQAIAEGRFKINPEAVADRLLDSVRDLVGGRI